MWRHPKYYKELRKRNKSDQAISHANSTRGPSDVRPGPGLKLGEMDIASSKRQASSSKLRYTPTGILLGVDLGDKPQASSSKQQATSESKPEPSSGSQASSDKL